MNISMLVSHRDSCPSQDLQTLLQPVYHNGDPAVSFVESGVPRPTALAFHFRARINLGHTDLSILETGLYQQART